MVHNRSVPIESQARSRALDGMFGALADPTRRAVLARLGQGERTVGELAQPFGMSLTGFIKHLAILEGAGLIEREKSGRTVNCRLKPGALGEAREWLERHEAFWNDRLDRLGNFLERKEQRPCQPPPPSTKPRDSKSAAPSPPPSPRSTRRSRTRSR